MRARKKQTGLFASFMAGRWEVIRAGRCVHLLPRRKVLIDREGGWEQGGFSEEKREDTKRKREREKSEIDFLKRKRKEGVRYEERNRKKKAREMFKKRQDENKKTKEIIG